MLHLFCAGKVKVYCKSKKVLFCFVDRKKSFDKEKYKEFLCAWQQIGINDKVHTHTIVLLGQKQLQLLVNKLETLGESSGMEINANKSFSFVAN